MSERVVNFLPKSNVVTTVGYAPAYKILVGFRQGFLRSCWLPSSPLEAIPRRSRRPSFEAKPQGWLRFTPRHAVTSPPQHAAFRGPGVARCQRRRFPLTPSPCDASDSARRAIEETLALSASSIALPLAASGRKYRPAGRASLRR